MRTYPVITYTDPKTSEVHAIQVDDHGISLDVDYIRAWGESEPRGQKITITGSGYQTVIAESYDQAFAILAHSLGKEIDRLKQHAHDEYQRGLDDGRRGAIDQLRELLDPTEEEVSFDD